MLHSADTLYPDPTSRRPVADQSEVEATTAIGRHGHHAVPTPIFKCLAGHAKPEKLGPGRSRLPYHHIMRCPVSSLSLLISIPPGGNYCSYRGLGGTTVVTPLGTEMQRRLRRGSLAEAEVLVTSRPVVMLGVWLQDGDSSPGNGGLEASKRSTWEPLSGIRVSGSNVLGNESMDS